MTAYRQNAHRLRIQLGPGRADLVSERPRIMDRQTERHRYSDLDADGRSTTVIEIPDDALVDIPAMVGSGAIEELPPAPPERSARKADGGGDG